MLIVFTILITYYYFWTFSSQCTQCTTMYNLCTYLLRLQLLSLFYYKFKLLYLSHYILHFCAFLITKYDCYTVTIRIVARFWLQITTTISWPHCPFSWWAGSVFWLAWWSWLFSLAVSRTRSSVGWLSYSCYLEVNIIIQKANLFISLIFAKDH